MANHQQHNPDSDSLPSNGARIHKAATALKNMLFKAEKLRTTGVISIWVPVESGHVGNYTTRVSPISDDS